VIVGVLAAAAVAVAIRYHRRMKVQQPLGRFLFRYFIGDYLMFPIRWCPGAAGMAVRAVVYRMLFRRMGRRVTVLEGVQVASPGNVEIGDNSGLGYQCFLDATGPIKIGSWVRIGPRVSFFTANHRFRARDTLIKHQGYDVGAIEVGDDVWLGANVTILRGVTIGRGAVIGAGSVVTRDVPEYAIAVGNPARVVGQRE